MPIFQDPDEGYYRLSLTKGVCSLTATEGVVQVECCPVPLRYDRNKVFRCDLVMTSWCCENGLSCLQWQVWV